LPNRLQSRHGRRFESAAAWRVCVAGALGLAVAMGIGPLRRHAAAAADATRRPARCDGAAWLAAPTNAGYLAGALSAARLTTRPPRLVLACLLATAAVTAAAAWTHSLAAACWLARSSRRSQCGVLVGISHWSVGELARTRGADASGWVFSGVGIGIAAGRRPVVGRGDAGASALWLALGGLALIVSLRSAALAFAPVTNPGSDLHLPHRIECHAGAPVWSVLRHLRLRLHPAGDLPAVAGAQLGRRAAAVRPGLAGVRPCGRPLRRCWPVAALRHFRLLEHLADATC